MNILKDVVRGASTQFGREFGRAGANVILKGSNAVFIQPVNLEGRIKPSDDELTIAYKELKKISFVTQNKANTIRILNAMREVNKVLNIEATIFNYKVIYLALLLFKDKYEEGIRHIGDYKSELVDELDNDIKGIQEKIGEFTTKYPKLEADE